ncbi:hypothetical protein PanWU01x14_104490 [Parasponia andersonii]|uniref:Uncharacterized protein n=1 Tax=Parasponia andersonii TaxID=3476 RepID=A0A2P5D1V0_PARAD|nr:hypothetical protein PanWU01x14_104490 [Parasponia andersonii]
MRHIQDFGRLEIKGINFYLPHVIENAPNN